MPVRSRLWAAWLTLDDPQRHAMDATFQDWVRWNPMQNEGWSEGNENPGML